MGIRIVRLGSDRKENEGLRDMDGVWIAPVTAQVMMTLRFMDTLNNSQRVAAEPPECSGNIRVQVQLFVLHVNPQQGCFGPLDC